MIRFKNKKIAKVAREMSELFRKTPNNIGVFEMNKRVQEVLKRNGIV